MQKIIKMAMVLAILAVILHQIPAAGKGRSASAGTKYLKEVEKLVHRLTNEVRRKNGLESLDKDEQLVEVARAHSEDMLKRKFFSHVNPDGLNPQDRLMPKALAPAARPGENIWGASGLDLSDSKTLARMIVDGWVASPGHRANLLNPDFTHMGIGVVAADKDARATQLFVRRKSQR